MEKWVMSVASHVIDEQGAFLSSLKDLIPSGHKLLYECVIEPDEVPVFEGLYLLVSPAEDDPKRFIPVKSLLIKLNSWYDNDKQKQYDEIKEWLLALDNGLSLKPSYFCDFLEGKSEKDGRLAYYPNRFPQEFYYFAYGNQELIEEDPVSFIEILT